MFVVPPSVLFGTVAFLLELALVQGGQPGTSDGYGDPVPTGALARLGTVRFRQESSAYSLAFSPDGKTLASGGDTIRLWDVATGKPIRRLRRTEVVSFGGGVSVAFSADGKILACGDWGGVILWEAATGKVLRQEHLPMHFAPSADGTSSTISLSSYSFVFSADGKLLAWVNPDQSITVWDVATAKELGRWAVATAKEATVRELGRLGMLGDSIGSLAFSPDGKLLVAVTRGHNLRLWNLTTRNPVLLPARRPANVELLAFFPDGKTVALRSGERTLLMWDLEAAKELRRFEGHHGPIDHLAVSPDGKFLASASYDNTLRIWDAIAGKELRCVGLPRAHVFSLAFSPDSRTLATGYGNTIRLWDIASGKEVLALGGHQCEVETVTFALGGRTVTTWGWDAIRQWDAASGKELRRLASPRAGIYYHAFSPDGRLLALAYRSEPVIPLLDLATGKELRRLAGHQRDVEALVFSADGKFLASGSTDGTLRLWDVPMGRELHRFVTVQEVPRPLAFSADGRLVAWGGNDHGKDSLLCLWDAVAGKERMRFRGHQRPVCSAAFSPDGRLLASGGFDGTIRLWETLTGKEIFQFGKRQGLGNVAFSPDGDVLASWTSGEVIDLWNVATGKRLRRLEGHQGWVTSVAFSPDGRTLASGSRDTTTLLWDVSGLRNAAQVPAGRLAPEELQARWADLAGNDASQAYRAINALLATSEQSVPFLKENVRPVSVDLRRINRLIADLDDNRFVVREKASQELGELRELAEPALRQALAKHPSAESQRRIMQLLAKREHDPVPSAETLRLLRAIIVLERLGSPEVRQLLDELAMGAPQASVTLEAKAALKRLDRRGR